MFKQFLCGNRIGYARITLYFLIIIISLMISYGGLKAYSILPADVVFSWGTVAVKILLILGMTLIGIAKADISSKLIEIFYAVVFVISGLCYYAIIVRINTEQFRRKKVRWSLKTFLIHLTGVGVNLIAPMGVDSFSITLAIFGGIIVSGYIYLDFFLVKKKIKKTDGYFLEDLDSWLK